MALTISTSTGGGNNSNKDRLYLFGFNDVGNVPPALTQGFKVGAKKDDELFLNVSVDGTTLTYSSSILMSDGATSSEKNKVLNTPSNNIFTVPTGHNLETCLLYTSPSPRD